ncbi:DUF695 domain-containing protein [Calidifontibacter terrae]
MGLFGRRSPADKPDQKLSIADFWSWWTDTGMAAASSAVAEGDPARVVSEMSSRVSAIASGLAWEFARGSESMHLLVVTAEGDPELRAVARRWAAAAPEPDVFWSYADSRQPAADLDTATFSVDDVSLPLNEVRVGVRRGATRVDVQVFHPLMQHLTPQGRATYCFLVLDAALGENATETWIGELSPSEVEPIDSFGLAGLRAVVRDLAAEFVDGDRWMELRGDGPTGPVVALARVPLSAASDPGLDECVQIIVSYDAGDDGLPTETAEDALSTYRDHLIERLEGHGRLLAVMTTGRRRIYYFYVDSTRTGAAQLSAAARSWPGSVRVETEHDPGWSEVAHLRG